MPSKIETTKMELFGGKPGKGIRLPGNLVVLRKYGTTWKISIPNSLAQSLGWMDKDIIAIIPTGRGLMMERDRRTYEEIIQKQKQLKEEKKKLGEAHFR